MRVSFVGEAEAVRDLAAVLRENGLLSEVQETVGTPAQVERLGFDLADILTVFGVISAAADAISLAQLMMSALSRSKTKKIEIVGPTGRKLIDIAGKSEDEVADAVRQALPFVK